MWVVFDLPEGGGDSCVAGLSYEPDHEVADSLNLIFVVQVFVRCPGVLGSGAACEGGKSQVGCASAGGASFDLGEFVLGADEADLESVDFAEPAFAFGFGDSVGEVVPDLFETVVLGGVGPEHRAADAGFSELNDQGA